MLDIVQLKKSKPKKEEKKECVLMRAKVKGVRLNLINKNYERTRAWYS